MALVGFSNAWHVLVFDSRETRDQNVESATDLATKAITRKEVPSYAANYDMARNCYRKPESFSGEYWEIDDYPTHNDEAPDRLVGEVRVCDMYEHLPRLYG